MQHRPLLVACLALAGLLQGPESASAKKRPRLTPRFPRSGESSVSVNLPAAALSPIQTNPQERLLLIQPPATDGPSDSAKLAIAVLSAFFPKALLNAQVLVVPQFYERGFGVGVVGEMP